MVQDVLKEVNYDIKVEIVISLIKVNLVEAPEVCKSLGATLPELKKIQEKE